MTYAPLTRWDYHVFSDVERRAWIGHGMNDPDLAYECAAAGLTPRQLSLLIGGETVLARLLAGEPADRVAAALQTRELGQARRQA